MGILLPYHNLSTLTHKKISANVTLQSRGARGRFCCGLGGRAVRAGSIGRDGQGLADSTGPLPEEAGGLGDAADLDLSYQILPANIQVFWEKNT